MVLGMRTAHGFVRSSGLMRPARIFASSISDTSLDCLEQAEWIMANFFRNAFLKGSGTKSHMRS
jgi:hypothetical protein